MPALAYYVSAHGLGHASRSCDVLSALARARPDVTLHVITGAPEAFVRARLAGARVVVHARRLDAGLVQLDSIRADVAASLRAAEAIVARAADLVADEARFLAREGVSAVVADIPAVPFLAAREVGVPSVAVANFGWDFIYEAFAARDLAWRPVVEHFASGYRAASLLLRLPFAEPMPAFAARRDLPLVARPGRTVRAEIARRTGADPGRPWVLVALTALEWDADARARVEGLVGYELFAMPPLEARARNVHLLDRGAVPFADALASCDVALSKPGYGILSECVVNDKPLVYVDREDFREHGLLVEGIRRYVRGAHLARERFYRGDLEGALEAALEAQPPPERLVAGGDALAAELILGQAQIAGAPTGSA